MFMFLFFKQKTAYEMRVSDWSSDVCSSDLNLRPRSRGSSSADRSSGISRKLSCPYAIERHYASSIHEYSTQCDATCNARPAPDHSAPDSHPDARSEEHTSELQSLMRISYAVFCLKKKKTTLTYTSTIT